MLLQATAIAFGTKHSAALLLPGQESKTGHHSLFTAGRGETLPIRLRLCHLAHASGKQCVHELRALLRLQLCRPATCLHCCAGFYGQLGQGDYESSEELKQLCIGYQQCAVSTCMLQKSFTALHNVNCCLLGCASGHSRASVGRSPTITSPQ